MGLSMECSSDDSNPFLEAVTDFANYTGVPTDALVKQFLKCFPLPDIIRAVESKPELPGMEATLIACLEKIFRNRYGSSLIQHHMPFLEVGLQDDSPLVRCLCCKIVTCLLAYLDENNLSPTRLVTENDLYPLLLSCFVDGDKEVASASRFAIVKLARSPQGVAIIFPENIDEPTHLRQVISQCSSLGRSRILFLIVRLFAISRSLASVVYNSNLLNLLIEEVENPTDVNVTCNLFEILYKLVDIDHGTEFLVRTDLLQLLTSMIRNTSEDPILRSRAMVISGRFLSRESIYSFFDESRIKFIISAIDEVLGYENENWDECESALEALGEIGLTTQGAILTLTSTPPTARYVIEGAFNLHNLHGHGKQIMATAAALHALGNISGESRPENSKILNSKAEENLQALMYETAYKSSELTLSDLILSVLLQQAPECRIACYRVISGMVVRPWFLMEVCSNPEIINFVSGGFRERTKPTKEMQYNCLKATYMAFMSSTTLASDPAYAATSSKMQDAVRRGPYRALKKNQPAVKMAKRF